MIGKLFYKILKLYVKHKLSYIATYKFQNFYAFIRSLLQIWSHTDTHTDTHTDIHTHTYTHTHTHTNANTHTQ